MLSFLCDTSRGRIVVLKNKLDFNRGTCAHLVIVLIGYNVLPIVISIILITENKSSILSVLAQCMFLYCPHPLPGDVERIFCKDKSDCTVVRVARSRNLLNRFILRANHVLAA